MSVNTNLNVLIASILVLATVMPAHAKKKGGGGGKPRVLRPAGALVLSDRAGDAIVSDGAPYVDENKELPTGIICADGSDIQRASCAIPGNRSAFVQMGVCVTEGCEDPFNGNLAGSTSGSAFGFRTKGFADLNGEIRLPSIGESITTNTDNPSDGYLAFRLRVNGNDYLLTWYGSGELTATGHDDDADGVRDRVTYSASADAWVELERLEYTLTRKKSDVEAYWSYVGTYTSMPIFFDVISLGYLRDHTNYWGVNSTQWVAPTP